GVRQDRRDRRRDGGRAEARRGRAAVPEPRVAADAASAAGIREAGGSAQARGDAAAGAAESRAERNGNPDLHSETDGLMAWRATHYVAAGALATGMLVWAAHKAWPSREIPVALPLVVTSAYDEWRDTLSRNEMLSDVLARAGITGREYVAFMNATHTLNPRRMQPGLVFDLRRLKGASVANRLGVRLDPEKRLWMVRLNGDSGWKEVVEEIPWNTERLRTTAVIQTNLYDALDAAIPDSFLPVRQRVGLAWAIADVYDWEVDFTRDLRPGDRVEVLIERLQSPEGERRLGRILAARVDVAGRPSFAL